MDKRNDSPAIKCKLCGKPSHRYICDRCYVLPCPYRGPLYPRNLFYEWEMLDRE